MRPTRRKNKFPRRRKRMAQFHPKGVDINVRADVCFVAEVDGAQIDTPTLLDCGRRWTANWRLRPSPSPSHWPSPG
jgi:hypothetical protein